jgi:hypothetical protein
MKSKEQITGLTAEEHKQVSILQALSTHYDDHKLPDTDMLAEKGTLNVRIKRYDLHILLTRAFGKAIDSRVSCKYIRYLLAEGMLVQNPTSHITKNKHIKPDNDTMYFIDSQVIDEKLNEHRIKLEKFQTEKNAIHSPKFDLMAFINKQSDAHKVEQ